VIPKFKGVSDIIRIQLASGEILFFHFGSKRQVLWHEYLVSKSAIMNNNNNNTQLDPVKDANNEKVNLPTTLNRSFCNEEKSNCLNKFA
jgi:hypothetical protein